MPRNNKHPRSRSAQHTDRAFSSVSFPGTPGPFTDDVYRVRKVESFLGASPTSAAKLSDYRWLLFMGPLVTRTVGKKMEGTSNQLVTPGSLQDQASSQDHLEHEIVPLDNLVLDDNINQEPLDITLGETLQPERPDLEDVLTQLTQEILTMRHEVATNQPQQPRHVDIPEDLNFNWVLLMLPPETKFALPGTGVVQRIAVDLIARLLTMAVRDHQDARFVLAVVSNWPDLDIIFQRLNLYTIVATYGWPTAIASSAVQVVLSNYLLPRATSLSNKTNAIIRHRTSVGTGVTTRIRQRQLRLHLQHRSLHRLRQQHEDEEGVDAAINLLL